MDSLVLSHDGSGWNCRNDASAAAGSSHVITLDSEGNVWVGGVFRKVHASPTRIKGLRDVRGVGAGSVHNLAVTGNGAVWVWCLRPFAPEDSKRSGRHFLPRPVLQLPARPGAAVTVGSIAICSHRVLSFGSNDAMQSLRCTNLGLSPMVIHGIELTGECAADFAMVRESFSGVVIHPGSFCDIDLRFTPKAAGHRTAELILRSSAVNQTETVTLEGYGPIENTYRFEVQKPCELAVPVAFEASARCGVPEIAPVLVEATFQEFVVTIPILVSVVVDVGGCRLVTEELVIASGRLRVESPREGAAEFTLLQRLQVELPLTLEAAAQSDLELAWEWS